MVVINDLYKTEISCDVSQANTESDGVIIKIRLRDYNNALVKNKTVTITCQNGVFTKNNSTTLDNVQNITPSTGSNGDSINLLYKPTSIGHGIIECNGISFTLENFRDTGWQPITIVGNYKEYPDGRPALYRVCNNIVKINGEITNTVNNVTSSVSMVQFGSIPSQYAPTDEQVDVVQQSSNGEKIEIRMNREGKLYWAKNSTASYVNLPYTTSTGRGEWINIDMTYMI